MHTTYLAYLDPTAASIGYQVLISSLLATAAACRLYWSKLRRLWQARAAAAPQPKPGVTAGHCHETTSR